MSACAGGDGAGETDGAGLSEAEAAIEEFKRRHRKLRKNWDLPTSFPSADVAAAYLRARVDECRERSTMGRPDVPALEKFCREKFGWPAERVRQDLEPVLKARVLAGPCGATRLALVLWQQSPACV